MAKTRCPQCSSEFERQGDFCPVCGYALTFVKEMEEEPAEQHSERLPGEIPPPPPVEELAPTEPIVMPVIEEPAPAPAYEPPPAEIIVVPPPAPARRRGLSIGARVGIGVVAVALVAGAVWAIVASQQEPATPPSDGQGSSTEQSSTPTATGPTNEESYELLAATYASIGTLSAEIGKANAGDTYGGTGFAYEVFNPLIGDPDPAKRESLVTQCEGMLKQITDARQELAAAEVAPAYEDQKTALLGLYDLLEQRMQVLVDTAEVAVDQPDESAWRPILTPKSTDLRKQFESAYPLAAPTQK